MSNAVIDFLPIQGQNLEWCKLSCQRQTAALKLGRRFVT